MSAAFAPKQVRRVYTQSLQGTPEQILPLLTPVGEKAWADGWDPIVLHAAPNPGVGTVFLTRAEGEPDTLWLQETFDIARRYVRYVRVTPGSNVTELDISLLPIAEGGTQAVVRYTYTGLSDRGNVLVESRTEAYYARFMREWEAALNHYLATGERCPKRS